MNITGGALAAFNGLRFEKQTSLVDAVKAAGYTIEEETIRHKGKKTTIHILYDHGQRIGFFAGKWALYKGFLEPRGIIWRTRVSKQYLPDEAFINEQTNTVYIIEKKFQSRHGSADEKFETCAFKLNRYTHLIAPTGMSVQYTYLCNDWFKKPKYRDAINYIWESKCSIYFNTLPLHTIGLASQAKEHPQHDIVSVVGVLFLLNEDAPPA